jgi:hydrogenase maturation protease
MRLRIPRQCAADTTLIVGFGSHNGDDQFGWRVAERLSSQPWNVPLRIQIARSPGNLLDWLDGVEHLIVCDACQGLGPAGSLHAVNWPSPGLLGSRSSFSHGMTLPSALELAKALNRLPAKVKMIMVEARQYNTGCEMSPEVAAAVPRIVELIRLEIQHARSRAGQKID